MQSSEELKSIILRLYEKEISGGLFDSARRLYSHQEGVLVIGSDPNDRYEDYESIILFYKAASATTLEIKVDDLKAYQEDAFGWVVDHVTARLPNGREVPVRHTYVFHQENNEWKIVHTHISVAVPDKNFGL